MKKYTVNINNFKFGEKRTLDVMNPFISLGAKQLVNFIPGDNNILMRRPGSKFIKTIAKEESENIKLFTLELNNIVYLLEFMPGKLRIYKDNVRLLNGQNKEWLTPYPTLEHLKSLNITPGYKSNEYLIFCKYEAPFLLIKEADKEVFSFKEVNFIDGPYENINTTDITLTPQKVSGENINVTASAPIFNFSDLGLSLRLFDEKNKMWGWGRITKIVDGRQVQINIVSNFGSYLPTLIWCKGLFNKNKGFPSMGLVFNSRLYIAHTLSDTTTVWASCYNDYLNFAPTDIQSETPFIVKEGKALNYRQAITFMSSEIKEIMWLKCTPYYVIVGSKEGIYAFMAQDCNKALSCYNFIIQKVSELGSKNKLVSNKQFLFYENLKNNINVLEYVYNLPVPNIVENIVQIPNQLKQNICINNIVFSEAYENIVTIILNNGKLVFININNENKEFFYAFSQGILGGEVIKIKEAASCKNYLYLMVERLINKEYYVTLEYINWFELNLALEDNFNIEDSFYLDCLEEQTSAIPLPYVKIKKNIPTAIIVDDCYLGEFCNETGVIELKKPATKVIHGYNYVSTYHSNSLDNLSLDYNLRGYKKLFKVTIGFINSLCGVLESNYYITTNLALPYLTDIEKRLCTGYRNFTTNSTYFGEISFKIIQQTPFPLNINLIKAEVLVN